MSVLPHKEVLATIYLAHHFQSAFTVDQVYRYLRVRMCREKFESILKDLKDGDLVFEKNGVLFTQDLYKSYQQKKRFSKNIFRRHRRYLSIIARIPWIKYVALTGANAFESCQTRDDVDLFLITKSNRLWICYLALVLFSKAIRKRDTLCINYLVDERNLHIRQHDYYTAVQILQMIPLFDNDFNKKIIEDNRWIFDFLPNACPELAKDRFYLLRNGYHKPENNAEQSGFFARLNRVIYEKYNRRLSAKYPREFGKGIILGEGLAKLNRIDHQDIYEEIYQKIYREIQTTL